MPTGTRMMRVSRPLTHTTPMKCTTFRTHINRYSAGHHQPVPQQALSRLQLHRVTFWEAVIAYRPRVSYAYLPVSYQAAFHPTPQPIADQSHIYAQPLPVTHHAGFDESSGSTLPSNSQPVLNSFRFFIS
ncbi:hypothetical protein VP01_4091g1 [Puccinia sorghi]|uniref:Uncharacterized protein n=1 Tax=Puccinia sorghi TaxID=27349 RepID=A0A0L6URD9_9BASI|nr:hypothetical protein VP01_4091g1 [Puccinia sorghi]